MAFIQGENYEFFYPDAEQPAISIDEVTIKKGAFCLLAGSSGSGKTTFLRQLKTEAKYQGTESGKLSCEAERIAYVWQNPASQIVTDRVAYEIVFGLENQGMKKELMQRRLSEVVTFFGLEDLIEKDTLELSGGEMQTVNIAAAIAEKPDLLLLDEPTSQLDPVAAKRLFEFLRQINEELGITIIVAEQRLEPIFPLVDQMIYMEQGKIIAWGMPKEVFSKLGKEVPFYFYHSSLKEARQWFEENYREKTVEIISNTKEKTKDIIIGKNLSFRYEKRGKDIIKECSFALKKGIITGLTGGNGSGKTTLLQILSGRYLPYEGKIKGVPKEIAYLPQNPQYLFTKDTLEMENPYLERFGITNLQKRHPADVSGGELQRFALCSILAKEADMYLLDEPTKGLDAPWKTVLGEILQEKQQAGKTVVLISHDMEFTARYTKEVAFLFAGEIVLQEDSHSFFEENEFYTTGIHRVTQGVSSHIVLQEEIDKYAEKKRN